MSMRHMLCSAIAGALLLGAGGCAIEPASTRKDPTFDEAGGNPLIPANYTAASALVTQLKGRIAADQPMIIATVVNIDALDRSSTLGRLISEQVSSRFALAGYRMIEMKFRNKVYMARNQGELMLTRELGQIAASHDAQAVIVGSYGESSEFIFVNLKVIQPHTNVILAVHDYALPIDSMMRSLLKTSR